MNDATAEDLQVKIAYLEHHLAELDGVLRALYAQVDQLTTDVHRLREERRNERTDQESVTVGEGASLPHEPPPHY